MNKIILLLATLSIGLSVNAFDWSSLFSQQYQPYPQYRPFMNAQPIQTTQVVDSSINSNYDPQYNQTYCQNPYQSQYQGQYVNPYLSRRIYGYGNNMPYYVRNSILPTNNNTGQAVRNIGQSLLYSMVRGY